MRDFNDSFSRIGSNFIILTETAGVIQPAKGTLNHPTPGKLFPLMRFDFLRNVHAEAKGLIHIMDKSAAISRVSAESLDG